MPVIGWVDTDDDSLTEEWRDAPTDPIVLARYLDAAYDQCADYLPHHEVNGVSVPDFPTPVPARLQLAQIMQARAIYNAVTTGADDRQGVDGIGVTVFPMDWSVKRLLRPKSLPGVL